VDELVGIVFLDHAGARVERITDDVVRHAIQHPVRNVGVAQAVHRHLAERGREAGLLDHGFDERPVTVGAGTVRAGGLEHLLAGLLVFHPAIPDPVPRLPVAVQQQPVVGLPATRRRPELGIELIRDRHRDLLFAFLSPLGGLAFGRQPHVELLRQQQINDAESCSLRRPATGFIEHFAVQAEPLVFLVGAIDERVQIVRVFQEDVARRLVNVVVLNSAAFTAGREIICAPYSRIDAAIEPRRDPERGAEILADASRGRTRALFEAVLLPLDQVTRR